LGDLAVLDLATMQWEVVVHMVDRSQVTATAGRPRLEVLGRAPSPRSAHSAVAYGHYIVFFGGEEQGTFGALFKSGDPFGVAHYCCPLESRV
jgi:hypothetical protein